MTSRQGALVFSGVMITFFGTFIWYMASVGEPRRDARLERQLEMIRTAQSIDDLRPVLEEIVRRQRRDYK